MIERHYGAFFLRRLEEQGKYCYENIDKHIEGNCFQLGSLTLDHIKYYPLGNKRQNPALILNLNPSK